MHNRSTPANARLTRTRALTQSCATRHCNPRAACAVGRALARRYAHNCNTASAAESAERAGTPVGEAEPVASYLTLKLWWLGMILLVLASALLSRPHLLRPFSRPCCPAPAPAPAAAARAVQIVGEIGNFLAYAYAPATLVSPLGVVRPHSHGLSAQCREAHAAQCSAIRPAHICAGTGQVSVVANSVNAFFFLHEPLHITNLAGSVPLSTHAYPRVPASIQSARGP